MPVLPQEEKRLSFQQLASRVPRKRCLNTIRHWHHVGLISRPTGLLVRLEACYEGDALATSWEAYLRFVEKLNLEE